MLNPPESRLGELCGTSRKLAEIRHIRKRRLRPTGDQLDGLKFHGRMAYCDRLVVSGELHAVDLCGGDERGDGALGASAFNAPSNECVLPCQGDRPNDVLHGSGVDHDATFLQEGLQPAPLPVHVGQFLSEAGLGGDPAALEPQLFAELATSGSVCICLAERRCPGPMPRISVSIR